MPTDELPSPAEKVKRLRLANQLGGISIDTSVYVELGCRLDHPYFGSLERMVDSTFRVLAPEVIVRETLSKLEERSKTTIDAAKKALSDVTHFLPADIREKSVLSTATLLSSQDPAALTESRWANHKTALKLEILEGVREVAPAVIDRYFKGLPPFAQTGKKKAEFPDAFALMTLALWAESHSSSVVVVSADTDWKDFCDSHPLLVFFQNLGEAIQALQIAEDQITELATKLEDAIKNDISSLQSNLRQDFESRLSDEIMKLPIHIDAYTGFAARVDSEETDFQIEAVDIDESMSHIQVIDIWDKGITLSVLASVDITVTGHFSFYAWDSIDRDYIPLGSSSATRKEQVTIEAVLILGGDPSESSPSFQIEDISLSEDRLDFDFGEVTPRWHDSD